MKHLLIALSLCVLPLVGQAQVNVTFGDMTFDRDENRICILIENHTSELFTLMPYFIDDRHKDNYSCITYRVKDKEGKVIYDSVKDGKVDSVSLFYNMDHIRHCSEYSPGQLPLNNERNNEAWLFPNFKNTSQEEHDKYFTFYSYLEALPENARTLEVDLYIRLYPMPDFSAVEKEKKRISDDAYLIPKPEQPPILYETKMHKTFRLDE